MNKEQGTNQSAWQNWSGGQTHTGVRLEQPESQEAISMLVKKCQAQNLKLRCVGSAHSFNPFWTDDVILSLDALSGLIAVDESKGIARIKAGTKLHTLGPLLWEHGLSLTQQGDIDRQSLAGALSTGTHGTGKALASMPNSIVGLRYIDAKGELVEINATHNSALLPFAKLSLGSLGVLVDLTLQLDPAFNLHEKNVQCDFAQCADTLTESIQNNRHFEFFWTANNDSFAIKILNVTEKPARIINSNEYIAPAYKVFPSNRDNKFNEMEYAVPYGVGWQCFMELREMFLRDFPKMPWPIEFRTMAADSLPLSPAYKQEVVTLSVHQGAERSYQALFDASEKIFSKYAGRPHWGKIHSLKAQDLHSLYPEFEQFCSIRKQQDPEGMFLNPYLAGLFL